MQYKRKMLLRIWSPRCFLPFLSIRDNISFFCQRICCRWAIVQPIVCVLLFLALCTLCRVGLLFSPIVYITAEYTVSWEQQQAAVTIGTALVLARLCRNVFHEHLWRNPPWKQAGLIACSIAVEQVTCSSRQNSLIVLLWRHCCDPIYPLFTSKIFLSRHFTALF